MGQFLRIEAQRTDKILIRLLDMNLVFDRIKDEVQEKLFPYPFELNELMTFRVEGKDLLACSDDAGGELVVKMATLTN